MTKNNKKDKNLWWLQSVKKSLWSIFKKYVVISHAVKVSTVVRVHLYTPGANCLNPMLDVTANIWHSNELYNGRVWAYHIQH